MELATMALHEALQCRSHDNFPKDAAAWESYVTYHRVLGWSNVAVLGLLLLTFFEVPLWCRSSNDSYWDWGLAANSCTLQGVGFGITESEVLVSGIPFIPHGVSLSIELVLLGVIFGRVMMSASLHTHFKGVGCSFRSNNAMIIDYIMVLLGFCDCFYCSFFPALAIRIAPFVRFGLAVSIPWVSQVVSAFVRVTSSVVTVGLFLVGTIVIFAWVAAMIFDDLDSKDVYGMQINQGFENFGNSLYTMFVTMTTAVLPDVMIPSYHHNRLFLFFWMPFFLLAVCVFTQVILATVYNEYQDDVTQRLKGFRKNRLKGISCSFDYVKDPMPIQKNGQQQDTVHYEAFVELVKMMRTFSSDQVMDDAVARICFDALDDDKSNALSRSEFTDMCDMLMTKFVITNRDSWVWDRLKSTKTGDYLFWAMSNGNDGPDVGSCHPHWAPSRFSGSPFDVLMNCVLGCNVVWMVVQSVYDLNDIPEPNWFLYIDLFFSFGYVFEVLVKLSWWSFEEYWMSIDNRFDFITTIILAGAGLCFLIFDTPRSVMRYLNLLRLVRLLKALNEIPAYERIVNIITRMTTTCGAVLVMNLLVIYLWSSWGMQLFGGKFYDSNPAFEGQDLDYFSSHFQIYNFNDMILSMVTLFFVMVTNWVDQIAIACLTLHANDTFRWIASWVFWLTFYVGSPLIAFNVFTAFSIDVFCKLEEMSDPENFKKDELEKNLQELQLDLATNQGKILHIQPSTELQREKVYVAMFDESDGEDGDEDDADSDC